MPSCSAGDLSINAAAGIIGDGPVAQSDTRTWQLKRSARQDVSPHAQFRRCVSLFYS